MPLRDDIRKILVTGSGPIVIGQAAEFDYSGSQACKALRSLGYEVVLVNSNPATIMTDPEMADQIYVEPLNHEVVERIIRKEKPDALLPTLGGQTGLNIAAELAERGVLDREGVELIGAKFEAIDKAEDRELFKSSMEKIGIRTPKSEAVTTVNEALKAAKRIGYPVIVRSAYTLGGAGDAVASNNQEMKEIATHSLQLSRIHQILVEESVQGWKEYELEVMRDLADNVVIICPIENFDPMGIHTGDSITVAPSQTLSNEEYQMLRDASIDIIREIGVETGGSNIQFAVHPETGEFVAIEMNPRVSRSSALASKATGFPIAKIAAMLAVGLTLDEIPNDVTKKTPASFEPTIDYVVVKIPRWPFDKFHGMDEKITTQMKSTGEVMAIGRTFEESLQKAVRSLDIGQVGFPPRRRKEKTSKKKIEEFLKNPTSERIFAIYDGLRRGLTVEKINELTDIDPFFIQKIKNLVKMEEEIEGAEEISRELLLMAKRMGFTDEQIADLRGTDREEITDLRTELGIEPTYKMVDTCAAEFEAQTPYYYSSWEERCELETCKKKSVLVIGAGPIRIGQGIEFDYCSVHAVEAMKEEGIETLLINNNPETVSTDYDTSDRLFFEPITLEDVVNVIEKERPDGVIVQAGGQTSITLAVPIQEELERREDLDTEILGTPPDRIDMAEDRDRFSRMLQRLGVPQPKNGTATSEEGAMEVAGRMGYPLLVRPSYVLGGRAMEIVHNEKDLNRFMKEAVRVSPDHPILIDEFLDGAVEIDVDAVADGREVFIGGIMEHIEEAGVHSGDSACVIPPQSLGEDELKQAENHVETIARGLGVIGFLNVQMAAKEGKVYVLEANPRSSRTIPYVSKAVGVQLAKIAAKVMVGHSLREMGYIETPSPDLVAVKEVVLPFDKLPDVDPVLGPEMKSTGEVMGIDYDFKRAFYKAELAAANDLPKGGNAFLSVRNQDKTELLPIARKLRKMGINLIATHGTAEYLRNCGLGVETLKKVSEGSPNIIDRIRDDGIDLIINTPTSGKHPRKDGYEIRRAAVDMKIPYITTIQGSRAASGTIDISNNDVSINTLKEYQKNNRISA